MTAPATPQPITLVVAAATSLGYGRGVLRGVYRYAKLRPHCHVMPMPIDSVTELARWSPFGFLVQADNLTLARQLAQLPAAIINIADNHPELPLRTIISENIAIGASVAEHFLARGFKRFAFFGPTDWYARLRAQGFGDRLAESPTSQPLHLALDEANLRHWLTSQHYPLAVMAAHDSAAQQVVDVARSLDLRVPEHVAVVGVDNDELLCEASPVPLSSVAVDAVRIGFEAARALDAWLAGHPPSFAQPLLVPPLGIVTRQSSDVTAIEDALVAQAVLWMHDHLRQSINIERLLDQLPVSRRHLEMRFRLALGCTPASELRRLRIERIKALIDSTDLSFTRIADEVGLASPAVLSQIFSREVGISPSQYRQRGRLPE